MDEMKVTDRELLEIAIKDLVNLAHKANNVIIQGSFNGAISDDVCDVLEICKTINNRFVEKEGK